METFIYLLLTLIRGIIVTLRNVEMLADNYISKTQAELQASEISAHSVRLSSLCRTEERFC
jgi:hypothetical protein